MMAKQIIDDVEMKLNGKEISVKELLEIDEADLSTEFAAQAARYAYFAVLEAQAERKLLDATEARKIEEATAFAYYKSDSESIPAGSKSVTDGYANQLVRLDEDCIEAKRLEIDLQHDYKIMRAISAAFHMRADMLRSLGAALRHEQDMTGMATRENSGNDWKRKARK